MCSDVVVVTGGAGYIGSHTCKALARAGFVPVVFDSLVYGHERAVKWGPLERGDICDSMRIRQVLEKYRPMAVLHFAAFAYVGESVTDPGKYYRNNVVGSLSLLEAMQACAVGNIVFSSTCATYGMPEALPIRETMSQNPINPYGASKLMVERMLADFGHAHDMRYIALRYFNAAGADPDGQIGEEHDPETHLIPLVLDAASGRRADISIFGTDYETPDGTCIRDYIHVSDLASAHVLALQALREGKPSGFYNLGNERGYSVREVIAAAERVSGLQVPVALAARRPGDPASLVSDATRAREDLGWKPAYPDLEDMVRTAWAWHQKRGPRVGGYS